MRAPKVVENRSDIKCLQCSLRVVLGSLLHRSFSEEAVDAGTRFENNLWTWSPVGGMFLKRNLPGVEVEVLSLGGFSYQDFAADGERYLEGFWPPERLAVQGRYASPHFIKESGLTAEAIACGVLFRNNVMPREIIDMLPGNLVISQVDPAALYTPAMRSGVSHYVVLAGRVDTEILVVDPGMPARTGHVPLGNHQIAWGGDAIRIKKPDWWDSRLSDKDPCPCGSQKKYERCGAYYFH